MEQCFLIIKYYVDQGAPALNLRMAEYLGGAAVIGTQGKTEYLGGTGLIGIQGKTDRESRR